MQRSVKEIARDLKAAEKFSGEVTGSIKTAIRGVLKLIDQRSEIDRSIDGDMVRLSEAAGRRDNGKVDTILAGIAQKRSERARATAVIEHTLEAAETLLDPILPGLNAAIAVAAAFPVLQESWFALDPEVQKRIVNATSRGIAW